MYILAFVIFEKDDKYIFEVRNSCCVKGIFSLLIRRYRFFETKQIIIYICTSEILKTRVKIGFSVHNIHLYWQVEDTKWRLCCRKIGVKCAYLRFLM